MIEEQQSKNDDIATDEHDSVGDLTAQERSEALKLAQQLDVEHMDSIISYGADTQQNLTDFSQGVLDKVQSQDVGPIGDTLSELMSNLSQANPSELAPVKQGFFARLFKNMQKSIYELTAKYQKIGAQVDQVAGQLQHDQAELMSDNRMLDDLYSENMAFFQQLNVHIVGAEMKLTDIEKRELPTAQKRAQESDNQLLAQKVQDLVQFQQRLEKRVHDLKLTRQMTLQQAPQIKLIQTTNQVLAEKIQTSINTSIPLWKNQVTIALTLLKQKKAVTAQRAVSDTTNELLKSNSDMLQQNTIETAKENERGVVDIETLQHTQDQLIKTIEETMTIQEEGRKKRVVAEQQMKEMEVELKKKLLSMATEETNKQ